MREKLTHVPRKRGTDFQLFPDRLKDEITLGQGTLDVWDGVTMGQQAMDGFH